MRMSNHKETILSLLHGADMGQLLADADEGLRDAVEAVATRGGKATITIKLTIAEIKGKDAQEIVPVLEVKVPAKPRLSKPYFVTQDNGLSRKHGSQPSLPGADQDDETDRLRAVDSR
jgi:hypothetical protein